MKLLVSVKKVNMEDDWTQFEWRKSISGKAGELVERGDNTYGGKYVVNPSGGLISKGHPLGATGLAQCSELCWQLRNQADKRQVPGARIALQHNIGLGGAAVVALYRLPEFNK